MNPLETVRMAFRSIRNNSLRAILTLMIIAFGITALVGILTAIDSAIYSLNDSFSYLGANTFEVEPRGQTITSNRGGRTYKRGEPFTYTVSTDFKDQFDYPGARPSVSLNCTSRATISHEEEETNPNVLIFAVDENYIDAKGFAVQAGRAFTQREVQEGAQNVIIGSDIVKELFNGNHTKALGESINAGNIKLNVIGTLEERGSSMNQNEDRRVLIPLQTGKRYFGTQRTNYTLLVAMQDASQIDNAIAVATGVLRNIRKLKAAQENDFEITKSDGLIDSIKENTFFLRAAAVIIALITLVGAAIGLMNIMLVSVTERTREIGISKAIGATSRIILLQFLSEAVVISLLGGVVGILLGVLAGVGVSAGLGGSFVFPWLWITIAFITCTIVGLISGLYPAVKASRLDPIESLRYE
ncbi:MAG TPA: ABC transporter permease [Saprospiraceae bacterium]|nr:ABC transporter permease [Saprospiraceae bacterium]